MMGGKQVAISNGSGFIVSSDGLILTNAHVVANKMGGEQSVMVKLHGGRIVTGHVIAIDPISDLAAVKINDGVGVHVWITSLNRPFKCDVTCSKISHWGQKGPSRGQMRKMVGQ